MVNGKKLVVSASPHLRTKDTTTKIMLDVIIALLPALGAATAIFGPRVLAVTATTVISAVLLRTTCNFPSQSISTGNIPVIIKT